VGHVVEILEYVPLKSKPEGLPYTLGLIEHRDEIIPLIDTGLKFGQPKIEINSNTCIVVINVVNASLQSSFHVAVVADQVSDVFEADLEELKQIENSYKPGYIEGAFNREEGLVLVMNVDKIFSDTDVLKLNSLVQGVNN
jgi:purine-binding chemotaxis protein CheW